MSKKKEIHHVLISWASGFLTEGVEMKTLQEISRDVEKLYFNRTGQPLQVTTIIKDIKEK